MPKILKGPGEDFRRLRRPLWNGRAVLHIGVLARTDTRLQENGLSRGNGPLVAVCRKTKPVGRLTEPLALSSASILLPVDLRRDSS